MIEDEAWLRRQIAALTAVPGIGAGRALGGRRRARGFRRGDGQQIVGLEIEIADIRGKWKASQNRYAADRAGVVDGLTADGDAEALAMAAIVRDAATK